MFLQLTAEDESFLAENATATLSQFEKVTANLGENMIKIIIQNKKWADRVFTKLCFISGSEDKILALASSGVKA